jgi:hypothetical protein
MTNNRQRMKTLAFGERQNIKSQKWHASLRMSKKSSTFAGVIENKVNSMARPIKETPTLYGEDARKGERYFSNYAIAGCAITGTKYATIGCAIAKIQFYITCSSFALDA